MDDLFNWKIKNVLDDQFYSKELEKIPDRFESITDWRSNFQPLIKEELKSTLKKLLAVESYVFQAEMIIFDGISKDKPGKVDIDFHFTNNITTESLSRYSINLLVFGENTKYNLEQLLKEEDSVSFAVVSVFNKQKSESDADVEIVTKMKMTVQVNNDQLTKISQGSASARLILLNEGFYPVEAVYSAITSANFPELFQNDILTGLFLKRVRESMLPISMLNQVSARLNSSQVRAVEAALFDASYFPIQLIRGPPGTGIYNYIYILYIIFIITIINITLMNNTIITILHR